MTIAADIAPAVPAVPPMALIHTTTVDTFRAICALGALIPQLCPVMGVDLTYLFYGRPAYRPGSIERTNRNPDSRPVCLSFEKNLLPTVAGVYPCDTGAHHAEMYSRHLDGVDLTELECTGVPNAEGRIVSRYFENNVEYFYGTPRDMLVPGPSSNVANDFFNFLLDTGESDYDDRARTVEVLQDDKIDLATALSGVVLPDFLLHEPVIATWTKGCKAVGVRVMPYRPQSHTCAAREVERRFPEVAALQGLPH